MIKTGNTKNKTYLFITALFVLIFMSCQSAKKNNTERQNEVELVAEKQLAFPLDEQTCLVKRYPFGYLFVFDIKNDDVI